MLRAKIVFGRPEGFSAKEVRAAAAVGLTAGAEAWHEQFKDLHFQPSAVSRYGYKPRTKAYQIRKAKTKRHQRPLVFTGRSHRSTSFARITASSRRGTLTYPNLPRYFYQYRKLDGAADKAVELFTVRNDEARKIGEAARDAMNAHLTRPMPSRTQVVR